MYLFDKTSFTSDELEYIRTSKTHKNREALATFGYFTGLGLFGFEKNYRLSVALLTEAMTGRYAQAYYLYGLLLENKEFHEKVDYTKAISFYKRSAELGFSPAMAALGRCYLYGRGIKYSLRDAERWLFKSRYKPAVVDLEVLKKEYARLNLFDKVKDVEEKIISFLQLNNDI